MSTISMAPTSSAIARNRSASMTRGYAEAPATISRGRYSFASRSTSSKSISESSRRTP